MKVIAQCHNSNTTVIPLATTRTRSHILTRTGKQILSHSLWINDGYLAAHTYCCGWLTWQRPWPMPGPEKSKGWLNRFSSRHQIMQGHKKAGITERQKFSSFPKLTLRKYDISWYIEILRISLKSGRHKCAVWGFYFIKIVSKSKLQKRMTCKILTLWAFNKVSREPPERGPPSPTI